jgi:hypothetical protein
MTKALFSALALLLALPTVAPAAEGDTQPVTAQRTAAREVAGRPAVRKEAIGDDEIQVIAPARPKTNNGFPRRAGVVAAGMGFAVLPPPVVTVESRPVREDRGFRVER